MKIIPFLLLLSTTVLGQDFITTKAVVSCIDSTNFVMLTEEDSRAVVFKRNSKFTLNKVTEISTQYKADASLLLSNGICVHLPEESSITINSAEQDGNKDENCVIHLTGEGLGIVLNLKVNRGRADFQLEVAPNESSNVTIITDHAELDIHAKRFDVVVSFYGFTIVRCYSGYILVTMSNNKVERIENEEVSLYDGNSVILRTKNPTIIEFRKER